MLSRTRLIIRRCHNGYITIELILSISLMAMGMLWSVSTYTSHYSRTHQVATHLYHLLHSARLLALSKQQSVSLYPVDAYGARSPNWNTTHIALDIGKRRYQTITIPTVPLHWKASLGNHQQVCFQEDSGTDGEQGRFWIGCTASYPCYQLVINYHGHIQKLYPRSL
jgi:hypothetical protein